MAALHGNVVWCSLIVHTLVSPGLLWMVGQGAGGNVMESWNKTYEEPLRGRLSMSKDRFDDAAALEEELWRRSEFWLMHPELCQGVRGKKEEK